VELSIRDLSKTYASGVRALQAIDLDIPTGMFGLLGPNGAGKSTLMRTLATLQEPDSGSIRLGEIDVLGEKDAVRRLLGYLPQDFGVYPEVDAETLLDHIAVLKGLTRKGERSDAVAALLSRTNLYAHRRTRLGQYSGGMKQRFGVAQALLGDPKLIIVDEPTSGLDPEERQRFLNLLSEIGEQVVVVLSTHIVEDVSELCTRMAIIAGGRLLYSGEPQTAVAELLGKTWRKVIDKAELEELRAEMEVVSWRLAAGRVLVHVVSEQRPDSSFSPVEPQLEDVYFHTLPRSH